MKHDSQTGYHAFLFLTEKYRKKILTNSKKYARIKIEHIAHRLRQVCRPETDTKTKVRASNF